MAPFRRPKAPFRGAPGLPYWIATCASAGSYVQRTWLLGAESGPSDGHRGAIFRGPGHETTYVKPGRYDDCADSVARERRPARSKSTGRCNITVGRIGNPSHESLGPCPDRAGGWTTGEPSRWHSQSISSSTVQNALFYPVHSSAGLSLSSEGPTARYPIVHAHRSSGDSAQSAPERR
jgi:hypothetical protein